MDMLDFDAVILAGGQGRRLGVESKPLCAVGGKTLLDRAVSSVAGAASITVAGPELPVLATSDLVFVQENPPFGGPVAGLKAVAAAGQLSAEWTLVLACDVPGARAGVVDLVSKAADVEVSSTNLTDDRPRMSQPHDGLDVGGFCLVDEAGFVQWLFGLYKTTHLVERLSRAHSDQSMRSVVADLELRTIPATNQVTGDVDTPADLKAWNEVLGSRHNRSKEHVVECEPTVGKTMTKVRFFAAAADAAGTEEVSLSARTLQDALLQIEQTSGRPNFHSVVDQCAILADGSRVTNKRMSLLGVDTIDVLPPFCGG